MANQKQLGIYWGNDALHLVESLSNEPVNIIHVPFQGAPENPSKGRPLDPGKLNLANNLNNTLREQKITTREANLSLPTKDIIFRTFVIPWMQEHEIKSAVGFEVSKYIPFSLKDLSYSFHSFNITQNNIKLIRIIFVAIKKETLESYTRVIEATQLHIKTIEPTASSLIRVLRHKSLLPKDQTVAIVERGETGKILIVDKNVPQFVREFFSTTDTGDQENASAGDPIKHLAQEIRISLEYFNRQNEQLKVQNIILLSSSDETHLSRELEQYFKISVSTLNASSIISHSSEQNFEFINAFGASLIGSIDSPASFDLSIKESDVPAKKSKAMKKPVNYKSLVATVLICIPIIAVSFLTAKKSTRVLENKIVILNNKLGSFQNSDIAFIEQQEAAITAKLNYFQKTRTGSNATQILLNIPSLLPDGTWLKNLNIDYDDTAMLNLPEPTESSKSSRRSPGKTEVAATKPILTVALEGYAYSQSKNRQFRQVDAFLQKLKNDPDYSKYFDAIDLETTQSQILDEHEVTYFKIRCTKNDES